MVDREPVADLLGEGRHQGAGLLEPGAPDEEGVPCLVARTAASEVVTRHRQVLAGDAVGPAARDRDHLLARRLGARERVGQRPGAVDGRDVHDGGVGSHACGSVADHRDGAHHTTTLSAAKISRVAFERLSV